MRKSILIGIGVGVLFSVIAWSHWYRMNSAPNGLKKAAEALSTRDLDTVDIHFDISSVAESLADAMLMRYAAISSHDDILGGTDFETARKVMAARLESGLQYVVRHGLLYEPFYSYEHDLDIPIDELILRARLHEAEVVDIREDVRDGNLSRVSLRLRYPALDTVLIYRVFLHKLNSGWRVVAVGDPVTLAETVEAVEYFRVKQANADAYRKLEGLIEGRFIWGYEEGEFFRLVEITFSLTNVSNRVIENPEVRISHPEEPSRVLYGRYDTILEPGETQRFTLSEFPNSASKLFQAILHESGRGVKIALHAGIVDGDTISAFRTWEELQESLQSTAH